ncbi:MAG: hypothetical protein LAQ30_03015 [Acidobacteriia bacterium]|nr:hypothetical protein [Terriglobia bacterium]
MQVHAGHAVELAGPVRIVHAARLLLRHEGERVIDGVDPQVLRLDDPVEMHAEFLLRVGGAQDNQGEEEERPPHYCLPGLSIHMPIRS